MAADTEGQTTQQVVISFESDDVATIPMSRDLADALRLGEARIIAARQPGAVTPSPWTLEPLDPAEAEAYGGLDILATSSTAAQFGGNRYTVVFQNPYADVVIEEDLTLGFYDDGDQLIGTRQRSVVGLPGQRGGFFGFYDDGPTVGRVAIHPERKPFYWKVDAEGRPRPYLDIEFTDVEVASSDFAQARVTLCAIGQGPDTTTDHPFLLTYWGEGDTLLDSDFAFVPILFGDGAHNPVEVLHFGAAAFSSIARVEPLPVIDAASLGLSRGPTVGPVAHVAPVDSAVRWGVFKPGVGEGGVELEWRGDLQTFDDRTPEQWGAAPGETIALRPTAAVGLPPVGADTSTGITYLDLAPVGDYLFVADAAAASLHRLDAATLEPISETRYERPDGTPSLVPRSIAGRLGHEYLAIIDGASEAAGGPPRGALVPVAMGAAGLMFFGDDSPPGASFGDVALGDGLMFVTDPLNHNVQIRKLSGEIVGIFGEHGDGDGQFDQPSGIHVDATGRVLVADTGNDRVQVLTVEGSELRHAFTITRQGPLGQQLEGPTSVTTDDRGDIFISHQRGTLHTDSAGDVRYFGRIGTGTADGDQVTIADPDDPSTVDQQIGAAERFYRSDPIARSIELFDIHPFLD